MTRRSRGPSRLSSAFGVLLALPVWPLGGCGSVPQLTFEPSANTDAGDAGAESAADATPLSDACGFPCVVGSTCAASCGACAACMSGEICCAKANAGVLCKQAGRPCPP